MINKQDNHQPFIRSVLHIRLRFLDIEFRDELPSRIVPAKKGDVGPIGVPRALRVRKPVLVRLEVDWDR